MAVLPTTLITTSGTVLGALAAASAGGDKVNFGNQTFVVVKNADAAPHTVTLVTPSNVSGLAIADKPVVVAASTTAFIGPFESVFVDSTDRTVALTYDAVTSLTVGAFSI